MNVPSFFSIVASLLIMPTMLANPIISFFMRQYPSDTQYAQELSSSFKNPSSIAHHTMRSILDYEIPSGIFSTYAGFLGTSNLVGQTSFPRKQEKPFLYLIFTEQITPMMMAGNTIHHWEFETKTPVSMYSFEQKQDPETKLFYWEVQEVPVPENNIIPLESIVVFIKPKNVYVPTGITLTRNTANLVLPDVYIKKGAKIYPSTLYVLNLKHFFGAINYLYEKRDSGYTSLIRNY